jgi:hypothetical protein
MRRLTIVIDVDQPDANWLWKAHSSGETIHGIRIEAIAEGDKLKEFDNLEAIIESEGLDFK